MSKSLFEITEPVKTETTSASASAPNTLAALLAEYAAGKERRRDVALTLWTHSESPLFEQLLQALQAAEEHGQWKAQNF